MSNQETVRTEVLEALRVFRASRQWEGWDRPAVVQHTATEIALEIRITQGEGEIAHIELRRPCGKDTFWHQHDWNYLREQDIEKLAAQIATDFVRMIVEDRARRMFLGTLERLRDHMIADIADAETQQLSYVSLTIEYIFIHTGEPTGYQENGIPTFAPKDLLVGCTNDDTGLRQAASILAAKGATIE